MAAFADAAAGHDAGLGRSAFATVLVKGLLHRVCAQSLYQNATLFAGLRDEPEDVRVARDKRPRNVRHDLPEEGELKRGEARHAGSKRTHDHDAGKFSLRLKD